MPHQTTFAHPHAGRGILPEGPKPPKTLGSDAPPVEYCHSGLDKRKRWILLFEDDSELGYSTYYDEGEALAAFKMHSISWNCHLFVSTPHN